MKHVIRGFDRFMRRVLGVFEFCTDPGCLLRVRRTALAHPVTLDGRTFAAGTPVVELHLWNEHLPPLPPDGPTLSWAVQTHRRLKQSFRALATHILNDPRLADAELIGGVTVLPLAGAHAGGIKLFEQLGFAIFPYHNPLGRFGEFWENLYIWGIMWAFNAPTLAGRRLLSLKRSKIWMTRETLLCQHGEAREPGSTRVEISNGG